MVFGCLGLRGFGLWMMGFEFVVIFSFYECFVGIGVDII